VSVLAGRSRFDDDTTGPDALGRAIHAGWMASAAWRRARSPRAALTQRVYLTGESFHNRNGAGQPVADGRAQDVGYRIDFAHAASDGWMLESGGTWQRRSARHELALRVPGWHVIGGDDFDARIHDVGLYAQARRTLGRVGTALGARVERSGLTRSRDVSPWLLLDWRVSDGLSALLGAGRQHQAPDFGQVVGRRGDPGLTPERARSVDVGFEGRPGPSLRWQATFYYRRESAIVDLPDQYPRLVAGQALAASTDSRYANRLAGDSRGVEVMLQRKSPGALSGWIAYSLGRTHYRDTLTGERFDGDFDQRHTLSLFARYRASQRMSFNARFRYGSNRPLAGYVERQDEGGFLLGSRRNGIRVPAYARLDVRADRTYLRGRRRLTLFAEVANALNRSNAAQVPPAVSLETGRVFDPLRELFPIVPSLGLTLEF
jgi:outer membrane receptor protein involved in Fe transport